MNSSEARFNPERFCARSSALNKRLDELQNDFLEGSILDDVYEKQSSEAQDELNVVFLNYMFVDEDLSRLKEKISQLVTSRCGNVIADKYNTSTSLQNDVIVHVIQDTKRVSGLTEYTGRPQLNAITDDIIAAVIRKDLIERYDRGSQQH